MKRRIRGANSQLSRATYWKSSLTPSYLRQQSSLASHTLWLIMLSLWSPDIASDLENYISSAHAHSCSCTPLCCLSMVSPHRNYYDWSLSEYKSNRVRCQRPHILFLSLFHTHRHTRTWTEQIYFDGLSRWFHEWDSSALILKHLFRYGRIHFIWPQWTVWNAR